MLCFLGNPTNKQTEKRGRVQRELAMALGFDEKPEYQFLKKLGLEASNFGCYGDGAWRGRGAAITSVNPSTNEVHNLKSHVQKTTFPFPEQVYPIMVIYLVFFAIA